jgi:hypothetical protein
MTVSTLTLTPAATTAGVGANAEPTPPPTRPNGATR